MTKPELQKAIEDIEDNYTTALFETKSLKLLINLAHRVLEMDLESVISENIHEDESRNGRFYKVVDEKELVTAINKLIMGE